MQAKDFLNAGRGANTRRLLHTLGPLLLPDSHAALMDEYEGHAIGLFRLGEEHLAAANSFASARWRQRVSRYYYAGHNLRRAVTLWVDGTYSTESKDHQHEKVGLPSDFPNGSTYTNLLRTLHDDRNMADYQHDGAENQLMHTVAEYKSFAEEFRDAAETYLKGRGVSL